MPLPEQHSSLDESEQQAEPESVLQLQAFFTSSSLRSDIFKPFVISKDFDMRRLLSYRSLSMYDPGMAQSVAITRAPKSLPLLAEQFKALGDETRLSLMMAVASSGNAEACVCDLTPDTGLAQSTVSHHLKLLVEAGLLSRTQRGKWAFYALTDDAIKLLKEPVL